MGDEEMVRKTQLIAIICIVLVAMLSACGKNSGGNDGNAPGSANETGTSTSGKKDEPTVELTMAFLSGVPEPPDLQLVQEELNKILKEKINATVKMMPISGGDYVQKMNLMLQSGEKLDLMVTGLGLGYYAQAAKGQLTPLDELIDKYGQGLKEQVGQDYLDGSRAADGRIYTIPTLREFAGKTGFVMRKDLLDKYGVDVSAIKTLDDLEPVLKTFKDNNSGVAPIVPEGPGAGIYGVGIDVLFDPLGDGLGVLPNYGQDLKVVNMYETKEYVDWVKRLRDWYQKGYILKDAATNKEYPNDLLKASRGFGYFTGIKPGIEEQVSRGNGMPMTAASFGKALTTTSYIVNISWSIARQSKSPEKAMEFLNLLYSDPEVVNLINYGIEGKHYVKVSDNVIKFPDGVDAATHPYNFNLGWEFGNQFLTYVMEGNDPEIWNKLRKFNSEAMRSKAIGFVVDVESIKTEIASVQNVVDQYKSSLGTGSVDPEKYLPEFIEKLKDAGIDKIVGEKQRQLDAWIAKQKQ